MTRLQKEVAQGVVPEAVGDLIDALARSVRVIEAWHGKEVFEIYFNNAPEMRRIKTTLAAWGYSLRDIYTYEAYRYPGS